MEKTMQITSKQDFCAEFPIGSIFSWIQAFRCEPTTVYTSQVINVYMKGRILNVLHVYTDSNGKQIREENAVGDLIGPCRGVFTTHESALAALRERKAEMKIRPVLRQELIEEAQRDAMRIGDTLSCAVV